MRAALYARVSDEEQVEGYSLDAQKRAFRAYAESQGWDIYQEYVDEGVSAHTDHDWCPAGQISRPCRPPDLFIGDYDTLVLQPIGRQWAITSKNNK